MAATVVLSPDVTARTSATVSIPAGSIYNFFLYTDSGLTLPAQGGAAIFMVTPTGNLNVVLANLDADHGFAWAIQGPADVVVKIPASTQNLGVARY